MRRYRRAQRGRAGARPHCWRPHLVAPPAAMADRPAGDRPGSAAARRHPGPDRGDAAEQGMRRTRVVIADPSVAQPPPGNVMLNVKQAWQYSTGAGVTVAMIDTGVTPNPRFPALFAGGDYVMGAGQRRADRLREPRHRRGLDHRRGTVQPGGAAHPPPGRASARRRRPHRVPANPAPTIPPPPPPKPDDGDGHRACATAATTAGRAAAAAGRPRGRAGLPAGRSRWCPGLPPGAPDGWWGWRPTRR